MSDNLPFEIQVAIIKRLPIKSLIRSRSVSKSWKSLIDSSDFIAHYSRKHTQAKHLLFRYDDYDQYFTKKYISIIDDRTFPRRKVELTPPLLVNNKQPDFDSIIGSSHGLLCFRARFLGDDPISEMVMLWNITIRKQVRVVVSNGRDVSYILGFGVCPETLDPKIVKIAQNLRGDDMGSVVCIPRQVGVFKLSTGTWRSRNSITSSLPRESIQFSPRQQVIDGILYWLATDMITMDGEMMSYNLIISFDLTTEEFREINLPDRLAHDQSDEYFFISKLKDFLVVLEHDDCITFVVWMMEDVTKTFIKVFEIYTPYHLVLSVCGFRNSGEPVIEIIEREYAPDADKSLVLYKPHSKHVNYIENIGFSVEVSVYSYMESLLLLDQPDFIIYDNGKSYISKQSGKKERLLKHTSKGKMKVEETTESFDSTLRGKKGTLTIVDPNLEKWVELEQQNVDIKRKKLELDQQKVGLKKKELELEQQKADLKRKKLELEKEKLDLKQKKANLAPLFAGRSKMQNCFRQARSS